MQREASRRRRKVLRGHRRVPRHRHNSHEGTQMRRSDRRESEERPIGCRTGRGKATAATLLLRSTAFRWRVDSASPC